MSDYEQFNKTLKPAPLCGYCSDSAPWTPYCWSCGSSSVNVNSVRPPAVKEPEQSSLSFYFVMLFGPCTTTFQWLINNAWAAGLCSVVYADILLEQFEPFDCQLCINVCVQKLLHPVWVRLKGSKGLRTGSSHHCKRSRCLRCLQTWPWFCPDPVSFVTPLIKWRESWEGWTKVRWSEISWFITMWWFVSVAGSPSAAMLPCSGHECCC